MAIGAQKCEELFGKDKQFVAQYAKPIEQSRQKEASPFAVKRGAHATERLHGKIKMYFRRQMIKDHLEEKLPPSQEFDIWTRLSPVQKQLYNHQLEHSRGLQHAERVAHCGRKPNQWALPIIARLRNLCNHPSLLGDQEQDKEHYAIDDSAKLAVLVHLVQIWYHEGHKILIFSHSTKMLDIIEDVLSRETYDITTCRIDGSTPQDRRKTIVDTFNSSQSTCNVMLLSIETGGEGLSLTGANRSIIYDPPWNQAKANQAVARIRRPGQTRECLSVHLLTAQTVEEKVSKKNARMTRLKHHEDCSVASAPPTHTHQSHQNPVFTDVWQTNLQGRS